MTVRLTTLFLTAALAVPGVAVAKPGDRDFGQTFPIASQLCQSVADGHVPKRLQGSEAQVTSACSTLQSAYDAAVAAAPNADAAKQAVADARSAVQAACLQTDDRSGCRAAIQQARSTMRSALSSYRDGVKAYHQSIRAARRAFWTTIKGLAHGSSTPTTGDEPTPTTGDQPSIPVADTPDTV